MPARLWHPHHSTLRALRARLLGVICCAVLIGGCVWSRQPVSLPGDDRIVRDQLIVYCDFPLPRRHRLLDELTAQRADLGRELGLPESDEPVHIYLFEKQSQLSKYLEQVHPDFGDRRALFVKSDTTLTVYSHWGERIAEDLRHEVTHGYLHSVVPRVPLWMDEGLAETYEVGRGRRGINRAHVEMLLNRSRERSWQPDLTALENISSAAALQQVDYAEAWLWVHWHLHSDIARRDRLRRYLSDVRFSPEAPRFSDWVLAQEPDANELVLAHLQQLSGAL